MFRGDGASQFALGNQLAGIAIDRDIPDMLAASDMNGFADSRDETFRDGPQVVGGDDRPHRIVFLKIDAHEGGEASGSFGQNAGRAAMQYAVNLVRAFIDRQPGFQEIRPDLGKFKAQMVEYVVGCDQGFYVRNRIRFEPYHKKDFNVSGKERP